VAGIEARENMPPYPHPELSEVVSEIPVECGDCGYASQNNAQLIHKMGDKMNSWKLLESLRDSSFLPL
jgi:hypothetical protein